MSDTFLKVKSSGVARDNNIKTNLNNIKNTISNEKKSTNESIFIIDQTPRESALKIDSFVPNLKLQRLRKNSNTKNHISLLTSSTYIKRLHATTRNSIIDRSAHKLHHRNPVSGVNIASNKNSDKIGKNIYDIVKNQKTTSSRIKSNITQFEQRLNNSSLINLNNGKSVINLPLEYSLITNFGGICKILRTQKEKEKLPDRINCDKRGLTSIPLFLNETNLRLLSLQHNLINVFHVPSDENNYKNKILCNINNNDESIQTDNDIDLPLASKINKHNIYFDKNDLKIDTTHNITAKKNSEKSITNDDFKKTIGPFTNQTATNNTALVPSNNFIKKQQGSKSYSACSVKNTINIIKNPKSKNLITTQTKPTKTYKIDFTKNDKNNIDTNDITSIDAIETVAPTTHLESKLNFDNNATTKAKLENIFMDKVLLNNSYAEIYQNLIFLDLYNNQIEKILNLDGFKSLTVLLLGKNRITDISGLSSLRKTLRVLDLHGNKITNIANKISELHELKSLNLAGNQIEQIHHNDFAGLNNLKELNLKRNKIKRVYGFDHLNNLERLWLCHNDLQKVDDMSSIAKAINLQEVTVENNPVSMAGDCISFLVSYLPNLKILSQMPVTEQVRKAALIWRKNKEISDRNNSSHLSNNFYNNIRREEVISNARTNWELLRSQRTMSGNPKYRTGNRTINQDLNSTIEEYIGNGMKQFHNSNYLNNNNYRIKTPIINSEGKCLLNTKNLETYCSKEIDCTQELQLPPITDSAYSGINDRDIKQNIIKSNSNSSLGPNLHSSSSGLGSDSEENSKITKIKSDHINSSAKSSLISLSATTTPELNKNEIDKTDFDNFFINTTTELEKYILKDSPEQNEVVCTNTNLKINQKNEIEHSTFEEVKKVSVTFENVSTNKSQTEFQTPKSSSTITSKLDSIMSTKTNNVLEKTQIKQPPPTLSNPMFSIKKTNKTSIFRTQTARIVRNNATNTSNQLQNDVSINQEKNININNSISTTNINKQTVDREREQGGDYLIEICGKYLNIYGIGALRFIDKQWNQTKACDVNTLNFSYINFNNIAYLLNRIKQRFPNAEKYIFRETNLQCLGQFNALADLQGIQSLLIESEGNQITKNSMWRSYAIFRLNHWGLKILNNIDVTQTEIENANNEFKILSEIVLWIVPETILQPIINKLRLDEKYSMTSLYPKEWLLKSDKTIREIVGKEVLQWKKCNLQVMQSEERSFRERAKIHFGVMIDNLCNAAEKLQIFDTLWPKILLDIITNTLIDYSQMEVYLKKF